MRRWLPLLALALSCDDTPLPAEEEGVLPVLEGEVVVFDAPIAGGAATAKLEIAPPHHADDGGDHVEGADYHFEAQIRYAAPVLGGRSAGDFVPYLQVELELVNLETGEEALVAMPPVVGIEEGWHYAADVDLDGSLGLSSAAYEAELKIRGSEDVVLHSDLLGAEAGTFFAPEEIVVEGFFTIEDLAGGSAEGEEEAQEPAAPQPGMGYGY